MRKINRHSGSLFTDFLKETGDYETVTARAMKRVRAEQREDERETRTINAESKHRTGKRGSIDD